MKTLGITEQSELTVRIVFQFSELNKNVFKKNIISY